VTSLDIIQLRYGAGHRDLKKINERDIFLKSDDTSVQARHYSQEDMCIIGKEEEAKRMLKLYENYTDQRAGAGR